MIFSTLIVKLADESNQKVLSGSLVENRDIGLILVANRFY